MSLHKSKFAVVAETLELHDERSRFGVLDPADVYRDMGVVRVKAVKPRMPLRFKVMLLDSDVMRETLAKLPPFAECAKKIASPGGYLRLKRQNIGLIGIEPN
jgi:hypothetical protein